MKIKFLILLSLITVVLVTQISALDTERKDRLDFGYVLNVENISVQPENIAPGGEGILTITLENKASFPLYDIRAQLTLPAGIALLEDISTRKIPQMNAGESEVLRYKIISFPKTPEGVYTSSFSVNYLNHVATEREENNSFSIVVKGNPKIFAEIEKSDIYSGNEIGDVSINFVNNEVANIKFFTVELQNSPDYEILSSNKKYVGDLDSNDFQSADFKLNVKKDVREVKLPIKVYYKDTFNKDYEENINLDLMVKTSQELGIKSNATAYYIFGGIVVLIVIFFVVRSFRNKRKYNKGKI
jgi:hypothetical protein